MLLLKSDYLDVEHSLASDLMFLLNLIFLRPCLCHSELDLHMLDICIIVAVCKNHKQKPLSPPQRKFCSLTSLVNFTNVAYGGMLVDRIGEQDVLFITSVHCKTA